MFFSGLGFVKMGFGVCSLGFIGVYLLGLGFRQYLRRGRVGIGNLGSGSTTEP